MNMKDNLIFFLSIFPIFIFRSNLQLQEISVIILIFFTLFLVNYFFLNYINKNKLEILKKIYISLILTYGIDNHLGLFNGFIQPNLSFFFRFFEIIYIPAVITLVIISLLFFIILNKTLYQKTSIIFLVTMLSLFIFNFFDNSKHYNKIPFYEKKLNKKFEKITVIMIWDEMSGMSSLASQTSSGKNFNNLAVDFFEKYNFDYYPNAYSISDNSVNSITSFINFDKIEDKNKRNEYASNSNNYFVEYEINKNKLFNKHNSVSVIQNLHMNYCNSKNVKKCYQYNPYTLDKINSKIDSFSKIISLWSLNGSIVGKFIWRSLKQLEYITSILEPEGEKLYIENILDFTIKDIFSEKYDLIFMHVLVPHKPYGYNKNCNYKIKKSNLNIYLSKIQHFKQHNIERKCVIKFMDKFLSKIGNLNNIRFFIISDHGSRITSSKESTFSSIFAFKDYNSLSSKKIEEEVISQELFKNIINN